MALSGASRRKQVPCSSPASGPNRSFLNGLHLKSKFLAVVQFIHTSIRRLSTAFFAIAVISASAQETQRPAFPSGIRLAATARGEAAITALGNKLPEVATHYRKTPEELRALLRSDHCLQANTEGRLFYACDLHKHAAAPVAEAPPSAVISPTDPAPYDTEEAFLLHTRPGANRVIYLDFDGHIDNTAGYWVDGAASPAFDTDGDPAVFSTSERESIIYIWQRVAEDFAIFDIDVTTEDPGVEALSKSSSSDQLYGIRCVIGGSSGGPDDWYTNSVGGVAYVGTFDDTNDVPCWVFPENLSPGTKTVAEAASHEVGHTLGLSHDGTSSVEYYSGHGNWAPIMGNGYSKGIVQWSKGEYSGANNTQDDLAVMLTQGAAYRTDDHGGTTATATFLTSDVLPVLGEGVIEKRTDLDFFRVAAAGGSLGINVSLAPRSSNLRLEVKLYDSSGTLLQTATALDTASGTQPVTLTRSVTAGNYYFSVDGIGSGDPLSTGYSDYASLGQYLLSITGVTPVGTAWLPTAAGTYQWNTLANWSATRPVINAAGAILRVNNNITGNQTIELTTPVTIGNLYLGDSKGTNSFILASSGGLFANGSLTFDNVSDDAKISKTIGANDIISTTLALTSNLIVTQSASGNLSLTDPVTGAGSLTKTGAGTLILSGAKSYTGTTTADDGVLRIDTSNALPSGNVTLTGGILGLASTFTGRTEGSGANQIQWTGDGGFAAFGADRSVSLGTINWASTSLNGNTLILGHSTADATLIWASNISFAGGSRIIQVNDGSDTIDAKISGVLSGSGIFSKEGSGTLELSNANTYTATTYLGEGLLLLSHTSALPTGNLIFAGGTLGLGSGNLTDRTFGSGTSQVRWFAGSGFAAFGATRAVKFSTNSLNWNDFFGGSNNVIIFSHPTANATLDWQQAVSFGGGNRTIEVLDGTAAIDAQISAIISGGTSGNTNQLYKTGEGTLALTEQNTYFGDTNITAGTLMIGNGAATGGLSQNSSAIIVSAGAKLAVNRSDTVIQGGAALKKAISGDGDFSQIGTGTTVLTLANSYTGDTAINSGVLEISGSGTLGTGTYAGSITIGTTFRYSGSQYQSLNGPISGSGELIKEGNPSTLTLGGANPSFGGNLTINAGTVRLGNVNALGGTSAITLAGGTTLYSELSGISTSAPITLGTAGSTSSIAFGIPSAAAASISLNGAISGAGNLTFTTPINNSSNFLQTIILGSACTYTGNTLITTENTGNTMSVRAGVTNALPVGTVLTLHGGNGADTGRTISYDLNGFNQTLAGLTNVTGLTLRNQRILNTAGTPATLTIQDNSARTFSGVISGNNLSLTKSGSGTFTLAGANTNNGTTTISQGTLALGANNVLSDSSAVSIGNATLSAAFADTLGTLDVTASATINLGAGSSLAFAKSSGIGWSGGTLNIKGSFVSGSSLRFGNSRSGLTPTQLASISAPGTKALALDTNGYLIPASYANWKAVHAPTGTPGDDFDGDGVANAIEYVLGGSATTRDGARLPQTTTSGGNFTFTFIRDQASIDSDTTLTIETGTNLASWPSTYAVPAGAVASNPGLTVVKNLPTAGKDTITLTLPLTSSATRFARLKVLP